ncbi:hypothetical protein KR009_000971, partial [Drosophila setifemur]
RSWDYEPLSIQAYSSDESALKITSKIDRIRRGEFAISMTLNFNYEMGDTTMMEATAYSCTSGVESDYKLLPWTIPNQPYTEFLNGFYKESFIKNVAHCSDLPQFEGKFEPPWRKGVYTMDKCVLTGEGLPQIAPDGYYRIHFNTTGEVSWGYTAIVRIKQRGL